MIPTAISSSSTIQPSRHPPGPMAMSHNPPPAPRPSYPSYSSVPSVPEIRLRYGRSGVHCRAPGVHSYDRPVRRIPGGDCVHGGRVRGRVPAVDYRVRVFAGVSGNRGRGGAAGSRKESRDGAWSLHRVLRCVVLSGGAGGGSGDWRVGLLERISVRADLRGGRAGDYGFTAQTEPGGGCGWTSRMNGRLAIVISWDPGLGEESGILCDR